MKKLKHTHTIGFLLLLSAGVMQAGDSGWRSWLGWGAAQPNKQQDIMSRSECAMELNKLINIINTQKSEIEMLTATRGEAYSEMLRKVQPNIQLFNENKQLKNQVRQLEDRIATFTRPTVHAASSSPTAQESVSEIMNALSSRKLSEQAVRQLNKKLNTIADSDWIKLKVAYQKLPIRSSINLQPKISDTLGSDYVTRLKNIIDQNYNIGNFGIDRDILTAVQTVYSKNKPSMPSAPVVIDVP